MINKRLINMVPDAMKHIKKSVLIQLSILLCNIVMMLQISAVIGALVSQTITINHICKAVLVIGVCIAMRMVGVSLVSQQNYLASKSVKSLLRGQIYDKVIRMGRKYKQKLPTADLLQLSVEGVEQLETYFGAYLPQFFYAMIAPLVLFLVVATIEVQTAVVLFICVPLIPISIVVVQKIAKKLLSKYWGEYTGLSDNFLENLQGFNTLKAYDTDDKRQAQMKAHAERFRVVTMKVLSMQLNSIIVMDVVAYGGAGLGMIFAVQALARGDLAVAQCVAIMLLAADFFLPLRLLGSFFHIAMNGVAASKKIFTLLDLDEDAPKTAVVCDTDIRLVDVDFGYQADKTILHQVTMDIPKNRFVSIVGKSGCGKSTIAGILTGEHTDYSGSVLIGGVELSQVNRQSLAEHCTLISANSYLFKGTVRENLLMAKPTATDDDLWAVLDQVRLAEFLQTVNRLDTVVQEKGSNFSGGQCQRLALARALLHDSAIYLFDEATSNIDVESENSIMEVLRALAKTKTVVLISHRLANVVESDCVYVLQDGRVAQQGSHADLLEQGGAYRELWQAQAQLEEVTR